MASGSSGNKRNRKNASPHSFETFASGPYPLHEAISRGHMEMIKKLLEAGADVNLPNGELYPLAYALNDPINCTVEVVKCFIDAGFSKDGILHISSKKTALHVCTMMNRQAIMKYLLSISANPNPKDTRGLTPMHYAVQFSRIEIMDILAKHGAQIDIECAGYFTPLMYAILEPNIALINKLLELGASLEYFNGSKKHPTSPLHLAAAICQFPIVQLLLKKGADVHSIVPATGRNTLHTAAAVDPRRPVNKVAITCIAGTFISLGVDVNATDKDGYTPLQLAIQKKNFCVAKLLIPNGSVLNNSINIPLEDTVLGTTTFHLAAGMGDKEMIQLCLEHGADMFLKDDVGQNPIHYFLKSLAKRKVSSDDIGILKLFWSNGFPYDKTMESLFGYSVPKEIAATVEKQRDLFNSLKSMKLKSVKKAVGLGAELKCCSTDVPYPLQFIASKGNEKMLELFLSGGVSPNYFDKRGETPLHVAAKLGYHNCVKTLLEHGAVFNVKSKKSSKTPLELAEADNHTEVTELLTTITHVFKNIARSAGNLRSEDLKSINKCLFNCSSATGDSLISRAIKKKVNPQLVQRLVETRMGCSV